MTSPDLPRPLRPIQIGAKLQIWLQILEFAVQELLEFVLEFAVQKILEFRMFAKRVGFQKVPYKICTLLLQIFCGVASSCGSLVAPSFRGVSIVSNDVSLKYGLTFYYVCYVFCLRVHCLHSFFVGIF